MQFHSCQYKAVNRDIDTVTKRQHCLKLQDKLKRPLRVWKIYWHVGHVKITALAAPGGTGSRGARGPDPKFGALVYN